MTQYVCSNFHEIGVPILMEKKFVHFSDGYVCI